MDQSLFLKILLAAALGLMLWRIFPSVKYWAKNSPKGSQKEWLNVSMLLAGVVLFVVVLIKLV